MFFETLNSKNKENFSVFNVFCLENKRIRLFRLEIFIVTPGGIREGIKAFEVFDGHTMCGWEQSGLYKEQNLRVELWLPREAFICEQTHRDCRKTKQRCFLTGLLRGIFNDWQ